MGRRGNDVPIEGVSADTTLLIAGPPMSGKYDLLLRLLAAHTERVIFVSTDDAADRVVEDFSEVAGGVDPDRIGVIDTVSHHGSVDDLQESETVKYAASAGNLTEIGVKFVTLFESFYEASEDLPTGVAINSVSQLLMHSDIESVYQFVHVLINQVRAAEWLGVAVVDTSMVDDSQLRLIQHHFDGMVETRENDEGAREFRVRGLASQRSEWTPF